MHSLLKYIYIYICTSTHEHLKKGKNLATNLFESIMLKPIMWQLKRLFMSSFIHMTLWVRLDTAEN